MELRIKEVGDTLSYLDEKGRVLMSMRNGRLVAGRYDDMTDECKDLVVEVFTELTGKEEDKIRRFLDFEDDEDVFCT